MTDCTMDGVQCPRKGFLKHFCTLFFLRGHPVTRGIRIKFSSVGISYWCNTSFDAESRAEYDPRSYISIGAIFEIFKFCENSKFKKYFFENFGGPNFPSTMFLTGIIFSSVGILCFSMDFR